MGLFCCIPTQAKDYDDWDGIDLSTITNTNTSFDQGTDENIVFLYNVGKKMFLNRGGSWGTEAVLSNVGMEFLVVKNGNAYNFVSSMKAESGNVPYLGAGQGNDKGYYVDQTALAFTPVSSTVDNKTVYQLQHGSTSYMVATKSSESTSVADESIVISAVSSSALPTDNSDKWIFVTVKEREQKFAQADIDKKVEVPATFLMKDNDFARRSNDVSEWKTDANGTLENKYGAASPSSQNDTYYVGNGNADDNSGQSGKLGGQWTANIHGASGGFYQELSKTNSNGLFRQGWYQISCHAFSTSTTENSNAYLYATVGNATAKTRAKSNYSTATIQKGVTAPTSYTDANDEVNKSEEVDGETVYTYLVNVRVYVQNAEGAMEDESTGKTECETLKFGVKMEGGASGDWLCVDNFEIKYIGEGGNEVVLDETKTDVQYMNDQIAKSTTDNTAYSPVNSTIYLHRSLTANVWNSLLLPFDMNSSDIVAAFGSGTIVSKYVGSKTGDGYDANTIYFEPTTHIEGGKLYIIKPTVGEPNNGEVEATSTLGGSDNAKYSLKGKYYTIPNIVYGKINEQTISAGFTATVEDKQSSNNPSTSASSKYYPAGTYVKKQGSSSTGEGYAAPVGSYMVLAAGKQDNSHEGSTGTWAYRTKPTSSLGFRAWLQPDNTVTESEAKQIHFVINGVDDNNTTAIDGITADGTAKTAAATGIYNLSGQRVSGDATQLQSLPKGLYIVNGKKVVVK